jgi:hypothetical protein
MLTTEVDTSRMRVLKVGTKNVMATGTRRAVRIALDEGADYARTHHVHTRRTGRATSREELFGEVKRADAGGSWGYLTNTTPYVRFIEFRTKPHLILPKDYSAAPPRSRVSGRRSPSPAGAGRGTALRFRSGGNVVFSRRVNHPGSAAMPFMYPASRFAKTVLLRETETFTFRQMSDLWD